MKKKVIIGLTYGDPAGVGPEILSKTLKKWNFPFIPYVIGLKEHLFSGQIPAKIDLYFHELKNNKTLKFKVKKGIPSALTGLFSYKCLESAVTLAKNKKIKALVTGPVSKETINLTQKGFKGQTDEIAKFFNKKPNDVIMLFSANDLRIALFTRHIALNEVSSRVTKKALNKFLINLNLEIKKWFKIKNPQIAVLGLNPHAGEKGLFGDEESRIIRPVIQELTSYGLRLFGPLSPDAVLAQAGQDYLLGNKQKYDVYVSFYHDQGLPMFKSVAGLKGVNVTLGLPFLRVSVDHGTGFDIAGKGKASPISLISAIKFLEEIL